jgi:RNA polymerase sigma-70 factor (ECF subfamily)
LAVGPGDPRLSERGLVAAFQAGSPGAFEEIVRLHRRRLFAIALRRTGDAEVAEDAVQVALAKAWRHLPRMDGEIDLAAWLTTVVQNAALDQVRGDVRQDRLADRAWTAAPERTDRSGTERAGESPSAPLEQAELGGLLLDAIAALPAPYRVALELYHVQGLSVEEVGRVLSLNENTVKSHLARGRGLLRRRLGRRLERGGWL